MKQWQRSVLCALTFGCAIGAGIGCGGDDTPDSTPTSVDLPDDTIAQIDLLLAEKEARTPVQRKISSALLYEAAGRFVPPEVKDPSTVPTPLYPHDGTGRVLVDIDAPAADPAGLADRVRALGGDVVEAVAGHRVTRVWLPVARVEDLASDAAVLAVHPAYQARTDRHDPPVDRYGDKFATTSAAARIAAVQDGLVTLPIDGVHPLGATGAVNSQGDVAHGANTARAFYGVDGTGIKVGVLSDSDDFKEASIASGDLPADTVTVPGQSGRPGAGEGTAMMEIVHDVAPGAQLFFATAFTSPESFADNIRTLRFTYGCDIIVDDIIYFFESPYQDDIIASAVEDVTADGAQYFSSAGNVGNFNDGTSGTFEADFKDAGALPTLPSGYTVMNFGQKVISNRIEVGGGPITLHWADPGSLDNPQSGTDYDVFLLSADLRTVDAAATDIQDGDDLPFEFLGFNVPANERIVVVRKAGEPARAIDLTIFGGELGISTGGSVFGHNTAPNAFAVAAVDTAEAGGGQFTGGATTPVELFSSDGNRHMFYDRNGAPLGTAGNTLAHGGIIRNKPDLAAADGVATTLPSGSGLNPFFGTSAAAPHAAGIAALMKAAAPTATPTKIRNSLKAGTLDIEAAGIDVNAGRGIVMAMNAISAAGGKPAVHLGLVSVTATPGAGVSIDPGESASVSVTVSNTGGANATNVVGTLTSTTPGVTITSGTSAYPALPSGTTGANTVPFTFSVDGSVICGARLDFALSLDFTGFGTHPTVIPFSVQTGAASIMPVAFPFTGPRVAIPDNNAAGANVSFAVSGLGSIGQVTFSIDGTACNATAGSTTNGIDHTWIGDLVMTLRSPSGTTITLASRAGGTGNSGNNFCNTVLTDSAATSIQTIAIAGNPWSGSFKPATPLSTFNGENANGTWTLNVSDLASIDTGGINRVTLNIAGFSCGL